MKSCHLENGLAGEEISRFVTILGMWILFFLCISSVSFCAEICLTLTLKNDEKHVENCLESVKDIIDCLVVCDAGSTDNSIQLVEQFLAKTAIPGKIYRQPWKNSVDAAQEFLKTKKLDLSATYLLVLDGDKRLHLEGSFKKNDLTKDAYLLLVKSSLLSCYSYNLNLLRASLPWKSLGTIYAYWSSTSSYESEKLRSLSIEDQGDMRERMVRDVASLKKAIQSEPENERFLFYLAQTLKSMNHYEEATEWYKKRIQKQGDKEEVWFSMYMLGECYKALNQWDSALFWLLEAYQYNPQRTDPLLSVTTYYRLKGQNDLAYMFTSYGSIFDQDDEQIFFDIPPDSTYRFDEERSIVAYYTPFREEGFKALNNLILKKGVPWTAKSQAYKNLRFYVQKLPSARYVPIVLDFPYIMEGSEERYHPMNPSILKTDEGYSVICRSVNYTQTGAKTFHTIDSDGIFRTRNFLAQYDPYFNLLSQMEITENLPRERVRCWISSNLQGLDDCRLFHWEGKKWLTCTTNDTNPTGNFQISLCRLGEGGMIDKLVPLIGPDPNRCEKNWVPFLHEGLPHLIYSYDPFIVFQPQLETGACHEVVRYTPEYDLSHFRGSAAPIRFDNGYLMVVHEVSLTDDHSRIYFHRFVYLDDNFQVKKLSKPFIFRHDGVEFCLSMTTDHANKNLILGVGVEDREAYFCIVDLDVVRELL